MRLKKPKNFIEQRLTLLTEIRNNQPERDWSVRDLAEEMQKQELIARFQPDYSKSSAHRDLILIDQQLARKRAEPAESYLHYQLEITEELIDDLMDEYRGLAEYEFEDMSELVKAKVNIAKAILAAQKRQASILPIDAPKKLSIETAHKIDIEHFYQIQQRASLLLLDDPTIVDGDFEMD